MTTKKKESVIKPLKPKNLKKSVKVQTRGSARPKVIEESTIEVNKIGFTPLGEGRYPDAIPFTTIPLKYGPFGGSKESKEEQKLNGRPGYLGGGNTRIKVGEDSYSQDYLAAALADPLSQENINSVGSAVISGAATGAATGNPIVAGGLAVANGIGAIVGNKETQKAAKKEGEAIRGANAKTSAKAISGGNLEDAKANFSAGTIDYKELVNQFGGRGLESSDPNKYDRGSAGERWGRAGLGIVAVGAAGATVLAGGGEEGEVKPDRLRAGDRRSSGKIKSSGFLGLGGREPQRMTSTGAGKRRIGLGGGGGGGGIMEVGMQMDKGGNIPKLDAGGPVEAHTPAQKGKDKIPMNAESEAFVVPKENADIAEQLRRTHFPDTVGGEAPRNDGSVEIMIGEGEHYFNADEAAKLRELGIDLDSLAPNGQNVEQGSYANEGGEIKVTRAHREVDLGPVTLSGRKRMANGGPVNDTSDGPTSFNKGGRIGYDDGGNTEGEIDRKYKKGPVWVGDKKYRVSQLRVSGDKVTLVDKSGQVVRKFSKSELKEIKEQVSLDSSQGNDANGSIPTLNPEFQGNDPNSETFKEKADDLGMSSSEYTEYLERERARTVLDNTAKAVNKVGNVLTGEAFYDEPGIDIKADNAGKTKQEIFEDGIAEGDDVIKMDQITDDPKVGKFADKELEGEIKRAVKYGGGEFYPNLMLDKSGELQLRPQGSTKVFSAMDNYYNMMMQRQVAEDRADEQSQIDIEAAKKSNKTKSSFSRKAREEDLEASQLMVKSDKTLDKTKDDLTVMKDLNVSHLSKDQQKAMRKSKKINTKGQPADGTIDKRAWSSADTSTIIGGIQTGLGSAGVIALGDRPTVLTDPGIQSMEAQAQNDASYGFTSEEHQLAKSGIEGTRVSSIRGATQKYAGSNRNAALSLINMANINADKATLAYNIADNDKKEEKKRYAHNVTLKASQDRRYAEKEKLNEYDKQLESYVGLMNTGVSNLIETGQLKEIRERLDQIQTA
tara:strand:+ start:10313 stop:13324 length:3012 start_codon:yes stop_codon:yes gene_type:complete